MLTFRNTLFYLHRLACEVGTVCSETSAFKTQTPGNYPKETIRHSKHGESLKSRTPLNLHSYHTQHSTLTLSTINIIAAHNSNCRKSHQVFPTELILSLFLLQRVCPLILALDVSYISNLNVLDAWSTRISVNNFYQYSKNGATFVFAISLVAGGNFTEVRRYSTNDAIFNSNGGFLAYFCNDATF
jgi:hypothetical protein